LAPAAGFVQIALTTVLGVKGAFMSEISPAVEKRLIALVERLPAFPKSVQQVIELSRDINCLPRDLVSIIEKDPVMTAKILKVINSAAFSLPNKMTSISQSVVYLGLNTVKNIALSLAALGMLPRSNTAGFDIQQYLVHSLMVGSITRQLAARHNVDGLDLADCYIAGLLHDFGKVVFAHYMPEEFNLSLALSKERKLSLHLAESMVIGADHAMVGSMLADRWQFPSALVSCIRNHHNNDIHDGMNDCLRVADQICRYKQFGDAGNPYHADEPEIAPQRFGSSLDAVIARLGNLDRLFAEAKNFAQLEAS
jgi:putative nucleotidyltransferase with HDIG domain